MKKTNKNEKRRLAFEKRNVKKEMNLARYGAEGGSALVMAKTGEFNRRLLAAFLALVFVLTTLLIGVNVSVKAALANDTQTAADGTYTYTISGNSYSTSFNYTSWFQTHTETITGVPQYKATISVTDGKISDISIVKNNSITGENGNNTQNQQWNTEINQGITSFLTGTVNARNQIIGKDATLESLKSMTGANSDTGYNQFNIMKQGLIRALEAAPLAPRVPEIVDEYVEPPELPESASSYLELNKTIAPSANGNAYDLNLESYSTADTRNFEIWEKVPTDYVVVVDQSASMKTEDMATKYVSAGTVNLEDVGDETTTDDKYYYVDPAGDTYRVFAETGYLYEYFPSNSIWVKNIIDDSQVPLSWFQSDEEGEFSAKNQYYYYVDNAYRPLTVQVAGTVLAYVMTLTYEDDNGVLHDFIRPTYPEYKNVFGTGKYTSDNWATYYPVNWAVTSFYYNENDYTYATFAGITTGMYINYPMYKRHVGYTRLVYRDKNGDIVPIPTDSGVESTGYCDSNGQAVTTAGGSTRMQYTGKLLKSTEDEKRLDALKMALQVFTKTVEGDIDSYGSVDNRIAFVGFSSENSTQWHYNNTELLSGVEIDTTQRMTNGKDGNYTHNGYFPVNETNFNGPQYFSSNGNFGNIGDAYATALVDASTAYNSIDYFTAYGGTKPADGLDMAKEIFDARDETTYTYRSGSKQTVERNKVVIFFTDGQPGNYSTSNQYWEANRVVEKAYELKHDVGAKIFSIGVFGVADATPLTYLRHETTNDDHSDYEYEMGWVNTISNQTTSTTWNWIFPTTSTDTIRSYLNRYWLASDPTTYGETANDTIYDYMSTVSSNYPNAQKFISDYWATSGENAGDDTTEGEDPSYQSWQDMINQLRGARIANYGSGEGKDNFYRLASNTESLIEAFKSAAKVTEVEVSQDVGEMDENVKTIDFINDTNFKIPVSDGTPTLDVEVVVVPVTKNADGSITEYNPVSMEAYNNSHTNQISWAPGDDKKSVVVTGFDYNAHCVTTENENAAKLVVKVKGLTPQDGVTGDSLTSNKDSSGVYAEDDLLKEFPIPAIARYKYELNVTDADADAQFNLSYVLAANQGVTADFNNILISNEDLSARELYSATDNLNSVANAQNGSTIYLEYITEQGGNGVVDPADYSLTTTIVPSSPDASSYTYYLDTTDYVDLDNPDSTKILPQPNGMTINSFSTTANGAMYVDSVANNRDVTFHLDADESPFVDSEYEFSVEVTLTGTDIASKLSALNNDNSNVQFTQVDANTITGTVKMVYGDGNPIDTVTIKVPDGATLSVEHTDPFYTTDYISEDEDGDPAYTAHAITTATDIYIKDTVNNDVGAGVVDNDASRDILYILGGLGIVTSSAGVAYIYRKKDVFGEE